MTIDFQLSTIDSRAFASLRHMRCYVCHKDVEIVERVGRRDTCPHCDGDLHICRNCEFYDPEAYNECRETEAARVLDKESANFCDYFSPSSREGGDRPGDPKADAKKKLEEMFKK